MSNEAKGPYRTGYERGYYTVIDGGGVVVYSDSEVSGVNMFTDAANYAHHHALAAQAERVRQLEEAVLRAIDAEPELPGPMPDDMWEVIKGDRTACTHALVVCVQETKAGIRERVLKALTTQAARVRELEEDREWLRSQWERHRKALNAIAWGEYDNVAFCRRLAQDELAIGVKVANDRAAATVAALTPKEPQQ